MKSYMVRMIKTVDILVEVETEHDADFNDNEIKGLADDVFINQCSQGAVWLKDSRTEHIESIEEVTDD